jgi:hypothetical protein
VFCNTVFDLTLKLRKKMLTASRSSVFFRRWLKPDVYPLVGAVLTGVFAAVYQSVRKLQSGLDVQLNREIRGKHPFDYIENPPPEHIERSKHGLMSFTRGMRESIFHAERRVYDAKHGMAATGDLHSS